MILGPATGSYDNAGRGLAMGDLDEDGYDDVLVGAPYQPDSRGYAAVGDVCLFYGPVTGSVYVIMQ